MLSREAEIVVAEWIGSDTVKPSREGAQMTAVGQRLWAISLAALAFIAVTGCSPFRLKGKDGSVHHVILGFGIVSVNNTNPSAASVTQAHMLGLLVTDVPGFKMAAGYSSATTVSVAAEAEDVRVEIQLRPGRSLTIHVPAAHLQSPKGTP
jgi:hypothetical protein